MNAEEQLGWIRSGQEDYIRSFAGSKQACPSVEPQVNLPCQLLGPHKDHRHFKNGREFGWNMYCTWVRPDSRRA